MGTSRARHKGVTSYYLILPDAISILLKVNYMSQRIISVFSCFAVTPRPRSQNNDYEYSIKYTIAVVTRLGTSHIVTIMIIIR